MSLETRAKLMQGVAILLGFYACLWSLAPYTALNWPARFLITVSTGTLSELAQPLTPLVQWVSVVGAGLLMSLAVICYGIIAPAIREVNLNALKFFKMAIIAWYLIDSIGSIAAGFALNLVFNTIFILLILFPVWGLNENHV